MTPADLAFKVESRTVQWLYAALGSRPSSHPFISGDSFRALADSIFDSTGTFDAARISEGDVVFVETNVLDRFVAEVLPRVSVRFTLVTHNSDCDIDEGRATLSEDPRIVKWFAQNCEVRRPKLQPIPIGLENRRYHSSGVVGDFLRLRRRTQIKKQRILFGFSLTTNETERKPALMALRGARCADETAWMNNRSYRKKLAGYAFVASPPGHGIDCHRTWEALYLGVVPVVKRSVLFEEFKDLPLLIVDDWDEIESWDEAFLAEKYAALEPRFSFSDRIWMDYWKKELRNPA